MPESEFNSANTTSLATLNLSSSLTDQHSVIQDNSLDLLEHAVLAETTDCGDHNNVVDVVDIIVGRADDNVSESQRASYTDSCKRTYRYQELLTWRLRIKESATELWLSPQSASNWNYYGLNAHELSQEWQESTVIWVLMQLRRCPSSSLPRAKFDLRMLRHFHNILARYQKVNDRLQIIRQVEFATLAAKHETHLTTLHWTDEIATIMSSSLHEQDRESLVYHLLRQRPEVIVHAAFSAIP